MIELLIFILASIGMSNILVDGSIFDPFKKWLGEDKKECYIKNIKFIKWCRGKLLALMNCYLCSGFWSGFFIALIMGLCNRNTWWASIGYAFAYACAGACVSINSAIVAMFIQSRYE